MVCVERDLKMGSQMYHCFLDIALLKCKIWEKGSLGSVKVFLGQDDDDWSFSGSMTPLIKGKSVLSNS
jgi:hypothetical protein